MAIRSLTLLACLAATPAAAVAADFDGGMVPTDHIVLPDGPATAVVALLSAPKGWGDGETALADALRTTGIAVIGIDMPRYLAAIAAAKGDCVYLIADIERLSHQIQRESGASGYHAPIIAGVGAAGGLALDLLVQSPAATVGGTVVTDPAVAIGLAWPLVHRRRPRRRRRGQRLHPAPGRRRRPGLDRPQRRRAAGGPRPRRGLPQRRDRRDRRRGAPIRPSPGSSSASATWRAPPAARAAAFR